MSTSLHSQEHYDLIAAFEREFRRGDFPGRGSLEREPKDQWAGGSLYQNGEVNALFLAYRRGYALGKVVQRDAEPESAHAR